MTEGGFFEQRRISPAGLTLVIAAHGAALTALAMAKMDVPVMKIFDPIDVSNVPIDPEPLPIPEPVETKAASAQSQIAYVEPLVAMPTEGPKVDYVPNLPIPDIAPLPPGPTVPVEPAIAPTPVRVEAQLLARSELQPPYPLPEQRAGAEGRVVIRVRIGADGRVRSAEKVAAASDAFYRATERHALRAWRFKPATLDGEPVESVKVLTVIFRLDG